MALQRTVVTECDLCISRGEANPAPGEPLPLGPFRGRMLWLDVCRADRTVYDMMRGLWEKYGRPTEMAVGATVPADVARKPYGRVDRDRSPDGLYRCPLRCEVGGPWKYRADWRAHLRNLHPTEVGQYLARVPSRYRCADCPGLVLTGHGAWYAHRKKQHGMLRGTEPLPPAMTPDDDGPVPAVPQR